MWLPRAAAAALGQISQLALCKKVSNVVQLIGLKPLQAANLQASSARVCAAAARAARQLGHPQAVAVDEAGEGLPAGGMLGMSSRRREATDVAARDEHEAAEAQRNVGARFGSAATTATGCPRETLTVPCSMRRAAGARTRLYLDRGKSKRILSE